MNVEEVIQSLSELDAAAKRVETLHALDLLSTKGAPEFERLTSLVCRLLKVPVSLVSFVLPDRQVFKAAEGLEEPWLSLRQTPLSHSFCKHVVASEEPLVIEDARSDPRVEGNPAITDLNVVGYAGIPLRTPEGLVLGSLCAIDSAPRSWTDDELEVMQEVAEMAMTEIAMRHHLRLRHEAEVHLVKQARALARSNRTLERFAEAVAHDLQEPLRTIGYFAQVLSEEQNDRKSGDLVGYILDGTDRMQTLIRNLLQYARLGDHTVRREPVDVSEVLATVLFDLQTLLSSTDAVVTFDALPSLRTDMHLLYVILQNLVSNAVQFHGPSPPRVEVSAQREADGWTFTVEDNGVGVRTPHATNIFDALTRKEEEGTHKGSGIGLALARQAVEYLGGRIWVEPSNRTTGSVFAFTIPDG